MEQQARESAAEARLFIFECATLAISGHASPDQDDQNHGSSKVVPGKKRAWKPREGQSIFGSWRCLQRWDEDQIGDSSMQPTRHNLDTAQLWRLPTCACSTQMVSCGNLSALKTVNLKPEILGNRIVRAQWVWSSLGTWIRWPPIPCTELCSVMIQAWWGQQSSALFRL